jgi:hypothetical protein
MTRINRLVQSLHELQKARPLENRCEEIEVITAVTDAQDSTVSASQGKLLLPISVLLAVFCSRLLARKKN